MLSCVGNELGDAVDFADLHVEHAAHVFDRGARAERAERDDLGDLLAPVLFGDVLDHLAAPARAEVDVDIGHADALGIEEALEQQTVLERIDVGDLHGVARRGCRRPIRGRDRRGCRRDLAKRMKSQTTRK